MKEAIEEVDKLRKKQTTLLNSLKLATGASTGADHIDAKIFALKLVHSFVFGLSIKTLFNLKS